MIRRYLFAVVLLLLVAASATAQTITASLRGTVNDQSGAAVAGATVVVTNEGTGILHTTKTNSHGDYVVLQLPASKYTVAVYASGFEKTAYTHVTLNVAQEARINAKLKPGTVSTEVQVNSTAILLQTEDAVNGQLLDRQQLKDLPALNRNVWQLAQLDPNVSPTTSSDSLATRGGFAVAGNIPNNNNYLLDGSDDNDWTTGQPTTRPSLDAIAEYKIITGEAPAEFGRRTGGQIILTSRTGSNQLHGGAFLSYLTSKWDASPISFTTTPAINHSTQRKFFGASLGGPIFKNRTFFFATYEGTRLSADPGVSGTSPLAAWLGNGALSAADGGAYFSPSGLAATGAIINPSTGAKFPTDASGNYVIASSYFNAASKQLFRYFPASASQTSDVFQNHVPNTQNENQGTLRIDHTLTAKDSLSFTYNIYDGVDTGTVGDFTAGNAVTPGFGAYGPHTYQHASLGENHTFTPSLLNEFRFGFNRFDAGYYNQDEKYGNVAGALGLPQGNNVGDLEPAVGQNVGVPNIGITGLSSIGDSNNPQWRGDNVIQATDSLTWVHGNHTAKFGFDGLDMFKHSFYIPGFRGTFSFTGAYTGAAVSSLGITKASGNVENAVADFLLGYIGSDSYSAGNANQYPTQLSAGLYAQDEWKATPRLKLNYGLRWEYFGPVREAHDLISYFSPSDGTVRTGKGQEYDLNSSNLLTQIGTVPQRHDNYGANYTNFAPRFGFTYRIGKTDDSVLRGGYGIYYGIPQIQTWNSANGLGTPFTQSYSFTPPVSNAVTGVAPSAYWTWGPAVTGSSALGPFGGVLGAADSGGSVTSQQANAISVTTINPHIHDMYAQEWSLGIQRDFSKIALFEITYQGSHTIHNSGSSASSTGIGLPLNNITLAQRKLVGINTTSSSTAIGSNYSTSSINLLRPYNTVTNPITGTASQWGGISELTDIGSSSYNSLLVRAQRRFESGLNFQSYLVYSRNLEVSAQNWYQVGLGDKGPASTDQKLRSVTNGTYALPFGHGKRWLNSGSAVDRYAATGWSVSTVLILQSGRPINVTTSDSLASFTGASDRAFIVYGQSPTAGIDAYGQKTHTKSNWFNTAAFRSNDPANGSNYTVNDPTSVTGGKTSAGYTFNYGTASYNSLRGPGFEDWDLSLVKNTKLHANQSLELRVEASNLLNHPNYNNPSAAYGGSTETGITSGTTGVITSNVDSVPYATGGVRKLQLTARYSF